MYAGQVPHSPKVLWPKHIHICLPPPGSLIFFQKLRGIMGQDICICLFLEHANLKIVFGPGLGRVAAQRATPDHRRMHLCPRWSRPLPPGAFWRAAAGTRARATTT